MFSVHICSTGEWLAQFDMLRTINVGTRVLLQDPLRLLDHVAVGLAVRPLEQRLLQLSLQDLHEAVRVCVVVDTTARDNRAQQRVKTRPLLYV